MSIALASRGEDTSISKEIATLEAKQDWPGLSALALQRLKAKPGDGDWLVVLGYARFRLKDYAQAVEAFAEAARQSPEDIDSWNMLGESQRLAGQSGRAIATLEHAATVDTTSHVTSFFLAQAWLDAGRADRAEQAYREALRQEPRFAPAWFSLGELLLRSGRSEDVAEIIKRLEPLDPALARELGRVRAGNRTPMAR